MQIAECPTCETPIDSSDTSEQQRLIFAAGALIATSGIVGMLMETPGYESAQPGFSARLKELTQLIERQTEEIGAWGDSYDEAT